MRPSTFFCKFGVVVIAAIAVALGASPPSLLSLLPCCWGWNHPQLPPQLRHHHHHHHQARFIIARRPSILLPRLSATAAEEEEEEQQQQSNTANDDNNKETVTASSSTGGYSSNDNNNKHNDNNNVLDGVADFERWFASVSDASYCDASIRHADFGNLRGLMFSTSETAAATASSSSSSKSNTQWMTIPRSSMVLQSDFSRPDWDAQLAVQLWNELSKMATSSSSKIAGYLSLLTQGLSSSSSWKESDHVPPSTAPDALRHWTADEKALLAVSASGQRLLDLETQQNDIWKNKFESLANNNNGMTWEQFVWAMEVVHSRAFCGDFGMGAAGSSLPIVLTIAAPVVAAAAGFAYYVPLHGQNDAVLLALAVVAAIPSFLNLVQQSPPAAVLLPLIDSANHLEEADSSIEYNSLSDCFTLSGGSKCLVKENDKQQLYISYGKKKDTELLLNYGFLRGVSSEGDSSTRRQMLAERFLSNNP